MQCGHLCMNSFLAHVLNLCPSCGTLEAICMQSQTAICCLQANWKTSGRSSIP